MRRWPILLLILVILITGMGCTPKAAQPEKPVNFYYPAVTTVYDGKTPVIQPEIRDGVGYEGGIAGLISLYLKGPSSDTLRSPFPQGVSVIRFSSTSNTATLELSQEFSQLSGIDLTLACACIANTLFDLTELDRVQIFAADSQLDGQASISLDRDDIYYMDDPTAGEAPAETTATSQ